MKERRYYSIRTGKHPLGSQIDWGLMLKLFVTLWNEFEEQGYFQSAFGHDCIDAGYLPGKAGSDVSAYFLRKLHKHDLWPIPERYLSYDESDLFDVIELLYDHVSKPLTYRSHGWDNSCRHYTSFDKTRGQLRYRSTINELLGDYREGYELSQDGQILHKAIPGAETLLNSEPLTYDSQNVDSRLSDAIALYKRSRSSITDKRNAVRMLADILEFLKPQIEAVLTAADERDLFRLANKFGIRHHNEQQQTDYDQDVWLDWMFYYYLATTNGVIRLIKKREPST